MKWELLKVPEINDPIEKLYLTTTKICSDDFILPLVQQYNFRDTEPNFFHGPCNNSYYYEDTVVCLINLPSYQNLVNPSTMPTSLIVNVKI